MHAHMRIPVNILEQQPRQKKCTRENEHNHTQTPAEICAWVSVYRYRFLYNKSPLDHSTMISFEEYLFL